MDHRAFLQELMLKFGPSGYEGEVAGVFAQEMQKSADSVSVDRMGNVIAKYAGTDPSAPVVMAFAHLDSLGFIVRRIHEDGFVQMDRLGGVPEKVLPGCNVCIRTADGRLCYGVFGNKSHHAAAADEKYKTEPITELYVDVGATSAQQVRALGIEIGCAAGYRPFFQSLTGVFVSGTSIDNRGGLCALAIAGEKLHAERHAATVYLVGTVWEEFNLRGAMLAARSIQPDITISLDVVLTGDTPELKNRYAAVCGEGPVLVMYTFHGRGTLNGTLPHEGLVKLTRSIAASAGIPLQHFAGVGILTDNAYVQLEGKGTAALELGFPTRYTHTPVEVANTEDIGRLGELLALLVKGITPDFSLNRY